MLVFVFLSPSLLLMRFSAIGGYGGRVSRFLLLKNRLYIECLENIIFFERHAQNCHFRTLIVIPCLFHINYTL